MKKDLVVNEDRHIIQEDVRFGFFQGKLRKEFEELRRDLQRGTKRGIPLDNLVNLLQEIKLFIEKHLKGKYTNIFVEVVSKWYEDDVERFFTIKLGRYESDEEYYNRLRREKEQEKLNHAHRLKEEAKQYLKLKKKFDNNKELGLK